MISSKQTADWFVQQPGLRFDRLEAYFGGHAYEPHRHDTYAIGITMSGVQSFNYRGGHHSSTPGRVIVIHPDEVHDGHAGSESGFRYRMLYLPPTLIQDILGGQPLPFIPGGITEDPILAQAVRGPLRHIDSTLESFEEDDGIFDLVQALRRYSSQKTTRRLLDYPAVQRAKDYLDAASGRQVSLADLEHVSGQRRWRLSRDFRVLFGTSPYRYLTMRRLDQAKAQMRCGASIGDAALIAGFTDQSHLTRQFGDAFGISPGRWAALQTVNGRHN